MYDKLGGDERDKCFIPFTVVKKDTIASGPTVSLTLKRQDGGKLFSFHTAQYITLRVERVDVLHNGHYSLIEPFNGNTYSAAFKQGNDTDQNSIVLEELIRNRTVGSTVLLQLLSIALHSTILQNILYLLVVVLVLLLSLQCSKN